MTSVFKSIQLPIAQLNLKAVLKCGQSFRWIMVPLDPTEQDLMKSELNTEALLHDPPAEEWRLTLEDRVICLRQTTTELFYRAHSPIECAPKLSSDDQDSTLLWLRDYFQLDIDLEALYADWGKRDPVFQKVAPRFVGIRILRQDPWENLNNHISRITSMVHSLCIHFSAPVCSSSELPGSPLDASWHSFPPPKVLAGSNVEAKLRELGFGYRAKYIQKTAAMLCEKHEDPMKTLLELRQLSTSEARARLLEFHGVGPKVADCILLMSLDKTEVVPVDTHVQQIATKMYGFRSQGKQPKAMNPRLYSEIASKFTDTWGPYAGWAHSVLFTADLKSFANFGLDSPSAAAVGDTALPPPSPAPAAGKIPLDEQLVPILVKPEDSPQKSVPRKRKSEPGSNSSLKFLNLPQLLYPLNTPTMSGNHFLRSMAEPASHEPERANSSNEIPEVHFADTVSVVTEVNKLSEAPLVDTPLELTTKDDTDAAKANEQIRRSASRDREMRDEEGLVLKAVPREPSEDPPTAPADIDVTEGVEKLEISSAPSSKKRKSQDKAELVPTKGRNAARRGRKPGKDRDEGPSKTAARRGPGARRRNSLSSQNPPTQELRRSKRRKSMSSQ
ncbi:unnamed protein product [Rhizoctonia solani]|uniref:DNA-(apurinic or apyrimidinic site) lyase n=1 Tax=Rhizoctonia solani TaxID=456999 RepID=A0A8H2XGI7_9AGAM|nr:unnamed protein product [Rhizoctonia solani]